jgi:hypothetical protein
MGGLQLEASSGKEKLVKPYLKKQAKKKNMPEPSGVAYTCDPSYSRGRH